MRHPPTNVVLALFKLDLSRLNDSDDLSRLNDSDERTKSFIFIFCPLQKIIVI
jgi:hypothetical protein